MNRSHCIALLLKSWQGLKLVSSLHNKAKSKFEMFVISFHQMSVDDDARCLPPPTTIIQPPSPHVAVVLHRLVPYRTT